MLKEINAILGEQLSAEDEEAVLAEFENLETEVCLTTRISPPIDSFIFPAQLRSLFMIYDIRIFQNRQCIMSCLIRDYAFYV